MKISTFFSLLCAVGLCTACSTQRSAAAATAATAISDKTPIERTYPVNSFTELHCGAALQVTYVKGSHFSVKARGSRDVLDRQLMVEVRNGSLYLSTKGRREGKLFLTVTAPTLTSVHLSGASQFSAEAVESERFSLYLSGASQADLLHLSTGDLVLQQAAASQCRLDEVRCANFTGRIASAGRLTAMISARQDAALDIASAGRVQLTLKAQQLTARLSSAAVFKGSFEGKGVDFSCASAALLDLTTHCDSLNVNCSSAASVVLRGEADKVDVKGSGAAGVDMRRLNRF